ncbi:MAG: hypothetical protein HY074_11955 [Deltaproteobacteria bacterium]|nr:hypothetical protein [Deltaproteobacteria bacterium]
MSLTVSAFADTDNSGIVFGATVGGYTEINSADTSAPAPGRVFVSIETILRDGKRKLDYAWITGKMGFSATGDGVLLPTVEVSIVPVVIHDPDLIGDCFDSQTDEKIKCPFSLSIRVAPTEFHRQVAFGELGSVTIHAIGAQGEWSSADGKRLIKAFVDTAGVRYMSLAANPSFFGVDLFCIGVQSTFTWKYFNDKLALSWSPFIAKGSAGFGISGGELFDALVFTGDLVTRLEAALTTAYGRYGIFAEAGAQAMVIDRNDSALPNDVHGAWLGRFGLEIKF